MAAAVAGEGPDIWAPEVGAPCQGVEAGDLLEVVGGASSGGIIVRAGREKTSAADARRLARGSRVRAREVEGERLRYELVEGEGPASGWVSITAGGRSLLAVLERSASDAALAALRLYAGRLAESKKETLGEQIYARSSFPWLQAKVDDGAAAARGRELHAALAGAENRAPPPRTRSNRDAAEDEDGEVVPLCRHCHLPLGSYAYASKGEKKTSLMHGECMAQVLLHDMREQEQARKRREAEVKRSRREEYDIGWRVEAIPSGRDAVAKLGVAEDAEGLSCFVLQEDGSLRLSQTLEPAAAVNLEYLSLALKVRRVEGREPLFSLDPVDPARAGQGHDPGASMQRKRFEPEWIAGTSVGEVMFQADYHLKELSMGEYEQPVVGMKSCFDYLREEGADSEWSAREWFIVRHAEIRMSDDHVIVPCLKMGVQAREQYIGPGGVLEDAPLTRPDHPLVKYADAFTTNFDLIAERKGVISQLREVAKASIMAKFILEGGLDLDEPWFALGDVAQPCCLEVPQLWNDRGASKIRVREGEILAARDRARVHSVYGGVDFGVDRFRLAAPGRLASSMVAGRAALGRPASTLMAGTQAGLSLAPTRQFTRLTAPLAATARLATPGGLAGAAAPLAAARMAPLRSSVAAMRPASALLATSRVGLAPAARSALTASLGARAGLAAPIAARPSLAAPLSAVSMAMARPGLLATSRLGMAGPQGVDLSLEKFNLSTDAGGWSGCLETPPELQHLAFQGAAFWADLDGSTSVLSADDRKLFREVFNGNLCDRQSEGSLFVPPATNPQHIQRLHALVKAEAEVREQRRAHFFSEKFSVEDAGPLFPSSWTSTVELDAQQAQCSGDALQPRPDLLAETEMLQDAIRGATPAFQRRTEDGVEFLVYRLGSLELRATCEPGAASPTVGAVFSTQWCGMALLAGVVAPPGDEERVAKVTEYVERSPFGRLRCQYYVVFHTVRGQAVVSERLADGTVTWQTPRGGGEERHALARVLRTADCFARGLTTGAVRTYLANCQPGIGSSGAASKRFAHAAYCHVSGERDEARRAEWAPAARAVPLRG